MATDSVPTGIVGLDHVLGGGLPKDRLFLIQGDPGVGKTTLALRFLMHGRDHGERVLYVTLSETPAELEAVARSHGWDLAGIDVFELRPTDLLQADENTLFHPAEVELQETTEQLQSVFERVRPRRAIFDSLAELRLLAQSPHRYRRLIIRLKQLFVQGGCTVVLLDDRQSAEADIHLQTLAHGVLTLEQLAPLYGAERRRLRVMKVRGVKFRGGYHDFKIRTGGLEVFPRLVAAEHSAPVASEPLESGIADLDAMVGGGIDRGTSTLVMGPPGSGKSVLATQYAVSAASRGERAALFLFDEQPRTLLLRSDALGMGLSELVAEGRVHLQSVDPAELPPGEFASAVVRAVEEQGTRVVVIDSLNGYFSAMPEESFLTLQMHELLSYLAHEGVVTFLVVAQHGVFGTSGALFDVSYLADSVILLRNFEARGRIRKALSVTKKRSGAHENTIREMSLGPAGITLGPPLEDLQGILSGTPLQLSNGLPTLHASGSTERV